jgi:hypothetical protein
MNRPSPVANLLSKAVAQHQSGRLSEAAALYEQVLGFEQENPRAFIGMYQFWVQKAGG